MGIECAEPGRIGRCAEANMPVGPDEDISFCKAFGAHSVLEMVGFVLPAWMTNAGRTSVGSWALSMFLPIPSAATT